MALLPVSNVVPIGVLMAERLLYLPSVGACLWAGQLPAALRERLPGARGAVALAAAAVLVALAAGTVARSADWRSPLALWEAELRSAPRDPVVNNNLAVEYTARGEPRRALERLDVTIAVAPAYWRAWVNRGIALAQLGEVPASLDAFRRATALAPDEGVPVFFLGNALADQGACAAAVDALERAERLQPEDPRPLAAAAHCLAKLGRPDAARDKLRRAVALDPRDAELRRRLDALDAGR